MSGAGRREIRGLIREARAVVHTQLRQGHRRRTGHDRSELCDALDALDYALAQMRRAARAR